LGWLNELLIAARTLARHASVTALAVLALALGIGASTAIFSVVDGVLLRPLPYPDPYELALVYQVFESGGRGSFSDPNFQDLRQQNHSFKDVAEYATWLASVSGGADAVRVLMGVVSEDFFGVLAVPPRLGRTFSPEEQRPGAAPVAVVSHGFWQRYLGATADLGGLTLRSSGSIYAVVGVMPPSVTFPEGVDVFVPRGLYPSEQSRTAHNWKVIARLRDGVTLEQARSDASGLARRLKAQYGADTWMVDAAVVPLREALTGRIRPALLVLLGAVSFLLLVACANVTNLLLAQAEVRRRELAVRTALGATRWRLTRQLLAEASLLSLLGCLLGALFAGWGVRALLAAGPDRLPRAGEIGVDAAVLAFSVGISVLTALALGLTTAWRSTRDLRAAALHEEGRSQGAGGRRRVLQVLVGSQVAATVVLLAGAGLLGRSLLSLLSTDPGFRTESVLAMDVSLPLAEGADAFWLARFHQQVIARLGVLPGAQESGGVNVTPLSGGGANGMFVIVNHPLTDFHEFDALMKDPSRTGEAEFRIASEGYFRALGIPLLKGRLFDDRDGPDSPHAALISASLARQKWPHADPLGEQIEFGNMDGDLRLFTIVGIVGDVRDAGLDADPRPTFYGDYRQRPHTTAAFTYVLRGEGDPAALATAARRIVTELDPEVPPRVRTLETLRADSVADRRFTLDLLATFGGSALVLAALGLYGVTAYAVARRTREIGVRMALGAHPRQVVRLLVSEGTRPVLVGTGIGLLLAAGLARFMRSLLYGVASADPLSFAAAVLVLGTVALLACLVPARRAARIDPMVALRCD
jgi:predicted permease